MKNDARARTPAGDALSALAVEVFRLNGLLLEVGDALAGPAGQSSARWQVLAAAEDAPRSVADVARALSLARQSVQRVADALVEDGLATYEDNPAHQRAKLLSLSATGKRALRSIGEAQRTWANRVGSAVGPTALKRAVADLAKVRAALEKDGAGR